MNTDPLFYVYPGNEEVFSYKNKTFLLPNAPILGGKADVTRTVIYWLVYYATVQKCDEKYGVHREFCCKTLQIGYL